MIGIGIKMRRVGKVRTLAALLSKWGSNAHTYLPGIGTISGLPTENYTSSTGDTGYSSVDGVVGLALDGMGTVGAELVTNGTFDSGTTTGWTPINSAALTVVSGAMVITNSIALEAYARLTDVVPVSGKTYKVTLDVTSATGVKVWVGGASSLVSPGIKQSVVLTAGSSGTLQFSTNSGTSGFAVSADNISVKEITGIHASNPATANKPLLTRGARNLLKWSRYLTDVVWEKLNGGSVGALCSDPDGTTLARTCTIAAPTGVIRQNSLAFTAGAAGTVAVWLRKSAVGGASFIRITTNNNSAWNTGLSTKITLTDSWTLAVLNGALISTGSVCSVIIGSADATGTADATCFGNVDIYSAGLFTGTLTASQILAQGGIPLTTTAAASNPLAGAYSWSFDGSNDSLALGSVPFQQADDRFVVIAGVVNATGILFDTSGGAGIPLVGRMQMDSGGVLHVYFRDDASTLVDLSFSVGLGVPFVASYRVVSGVRVLRVNGVQRATSSAALGTTTVTDCRIGGAALATPVALVSASMNAYLPVKGTATDAELLALERLVGQLAGVTI